MYFLKENTVFGGEFLLFDLGLQSEVFNCLYKW